MEFECQHITKASKSSLDSDRNNTDNPCEFAHAKHPLSDCSSSKDIAISCDSKCPHGDGVSPNIHHSITDLPAPLISEILNFLDPKDLGIVSCVSTALNKLAYENDVWRKVYCERWGIPQSSTFLNLGKSNAKSWKELFVKRESRAKTFLGKYTLDALHGHTETVRTVFLLPSAKLIFTSGYDSTVRIWDMEDGLSLASSHPLGCTVRAIAADTKLLVAGGTDTFIQGWFATKDLSCLFDLRYRNNPGSGFRLWGHGGPVSCLALDPLRIYSGSWEMTVRIWSRSSLKCLRVLKHRDWVWGLVPHENTVASIAGPDLYIWETCGGKLKTIVKTAHKGNAYGLAKSHTGGFLFTGGEDGAIHMFEIINHHTATKAYKLATWAPHTGPVHSLTFEFPWLVSASADGRLSLIDVRKLMKPRRCFVNRSLCPTHDTGPHMATPERMLHGFSLGLFSVGVGSDRIVCGGEDGIVRMWNFSEALEADQRASEQRAKRLENRMHRHSFQLGLSRKGSQAADNCSAVANSFDKGGVSRMSTKVEA